MRRSRLGSVLGLAGALLALSLLAGCATKRPVLYPNEHLRSVDEERARWDVDECVRLAKQYGESESIAGNAAESAAVGGAAGAATGAVVEGVSVGRGAAAGAAGAGAASVMRGVFRKRDPDPIQRRYAERCLRERGYETIGWR